MARLEPGWAPGEAVFSGRRGDTGGAIVIPRRDHLRAPEPRRGINAGPRIAIDQDAVPVGAVMVGIPAVVWLAKAITGLPAPTGESPVLTIGLIDAINRPAP